MTVSVADAEAREDIYRLLYEVYVVEMGMGAENADHQNRQLRGDDVDNATLVGVRMDDRIVGSIGMLFGANGFSEELEECFDISRYASVVPRHRMAVSIRFCVAEDFRSTTVPLALIMDAARRQRDEGIELSFADCQPHLLGLYQALGFRQCAPTFDQVGPGMVIPLVLVAGDVDHIRTIRSPLCELMAEGDSQTPTARRVLDLLLDFSDSGSFTEQSWSDAYEALTRVDRRSGLFDDLSSDEFDALVAAGHIIECNAGQSIVSASQGTRTVFVVIDGEIVVQTNGRTIARLGRGEPFGEVAFLLGTKRTADVVAVSDSTRVIALSERVLRRLITSGSPLAAKFLYNLSKSLAYKLVEESPLFANDNVR